jgi:cytochrome b
MKPAVVLLWDPLIRLFHWSLAAIFVANYWINEAGEDWHKWLGYIAVAWLFVRVVWGFVGGKGAARWVDFFPSPSRLMLHIKSLFNGTGYHVMGHSPLGAVVMLFMMSLVLVLGISGFMMEEIDYFWGEEWVQNLHSWTANALLYLVIIHVIAAVIESYRLKENLPLSMITGKRQRKD